MYSYPMAYKNPEKAKRYYRSYARRPDRLAARTAATRRYRQQHPERRKHVRLRQGYKLSLLDYYALLSAQGGGCAICGGMPTSNRTWFTIDHDHTCCPGKRSCGKCVRGLLCASCNSGMGYFKDNSTRLRLAAKYLEMYAS